MNLFQKKHDWILGGFEFLHVDNVVADAGSGGSTFGTDEIGGVHYPRSKVVWGADGAVNDTSAAAPLPVVQTGTPALPTGAATAAKQDTEIASLAALAGAVAGTEMQVDIVSSALPSGAATAAKQPALGTAGTASADVLTVQGVASMTALKVDGSAVTQPISDASGSITTDTPQLPTTIGQKTGAASVSVVLASDQANVGVTDGGTSLTTDSPQLPAALGQTTMAASMSVALASNQSSIPVAATLTAETTKVIGTVNIAAAQTIAATNAGTFAVQAGQAAHDAAIAGNPVRVAGRAVSADYAAVATGDTADFITDLNGKQIVLPYAIPENMEYGVTAAITGTAAVEVLAAAAAGIRHYITSLTVINSHATVGTVVEIRDGTTTVIHRGYAAPVGGGYSVTFPVPLRGTAATALNAYNITNASNVYVSASGYKAP